MSTHLKICVGYCAQLIGMAILGGQADVGIMRIPFKMRENIRRDRRMNRDDVINKLRAHEPELKAAGIVRLAVFGSVARGDNSPESDVDLLADFDKTKHYTLLTMGRLENRLADLLGTRVDLSSPEWLKESVKNQVLEEAVLAF
jgi:uncharacterized protein